jgi:hypothetical protein
MMKYMGSVDLSEEVLTYHCHWISFDCPQKRALITLTITQVEPEGWILNVDGGVLIIDKSG